MFPSQHLNVPKGNVSGYCMRDTTLMRIRTTTQLVSLERAARTVFPSALHPALARMMRTDFDVNPADSQSRELMIKAAAAIHVWTLHTIMSMEEGRRLPSAVEDKLRALRSVQNDTDVSWNNLDIVWGLFLIYANNRCHHAPTEPRTTAPTPFNDDPVEACLAQLECVQPELILADDLFDSIPVKRATYFVARHLLRQIEAPSLRSLGPVIRTVKVQATSVDKNLDVYCDGLEYREFGITIDFEIRPSERNPGHVFNDLSFTFTITGDSGVTFPSSVARSTSWGEGDMLSVYKAKLATQAGPEHRLQSVWVGYALRTGESGRLVVELPSHTP